MAGKVKWVSDIDRTVLVSNFERLGWIRGSTEGREGNLVRSDMSPSMHTLAHYFYLWWSQVMTGTFTGNVSTVLLPWLLYY